jgi:uncharacterized Zn finger protein (UPF0148 family)
MSSKQDHVLEIVCPCCQATLWIEAETGRLVKSERAAAAVRKKESLDDLLVREKKKKEGFATKFESTAEVEKQKREKAKEAFEKALGKIDEDPKPD